MARVFTEGFEFQDLLFFDVPGSQISITTNATYVRSGSAAIFRPKAAYKYLPSALTEMYVRFALRDDTKIYSGTYFTWGKQGVGDLGSLRYNTDSSKFTLYVGGSLVATGTTIFNPANYYLFELHIKIANAGGILELKIDGQPVEATFSGDTQPGAATDVDYFQFLQPTDSNTATFDDIALNDTTGVADNSWCGDGHVILLKPNGAGDETNWTASTGSNYTCVDDIPPNTTDYVSISGVDLRDLYNLTACGLTNSSIYRVWAEARALDTVAAGGTICLPIKTGGAVYDDTTPTLALLTSYSKQLLGIEHKTNPQAGGAWTVEQLDALQVGCQVKS